MRFVPILLLAFSLSAATVEEARKLLSDAAQHKEADVRKETARALSLVPARDEASKLLDQLVKDKDYQTRVEALSSLAELNDRSRVGLLKEGLEDEVPEVSYAAAQALYGLKIPEGREALEQVFFGDRKGKSSFFGRFKMDAWRQLKTPRTAALFGLRQGLGFVPVPGLGRGFNAIMGVLTSIDLSVRAVTLLSLCEDAKDKACPLLIETGLKDEDWSVRAVSLHLVSDRKMTKLLPVVDELMADKKDMVQFRAAAIKLRFAAASPKRLRKGAGGN
ncbi:MAG: hypothetical protein OHK0021_24100 [Bryobacter sp.]